MVDRHRARQKTSATAEDTAQRQMPAQLADPITLIFLGLLFVGLMSLCLAAWFIYQQRSAHPVAPLLTPSLTTEANASSTPQAPLRRKDADQTRETQHAEIARLRSDLERTQQELAVARDQLEALPPPGATVLDKPPLALILDVPVYKQQRPLSCESSAAAMAANFHGVSVSEQDILLALPIHENPHLGFRGNVDGSYGGIGDYGVYAEPIRQVLANLGLQVQPLSGGPDQIRAHIREGKPVIVWITYRLQPQTPQRVQLSDGQWVVLVPYEHSVLVVGYNRDGLWVNDPYAGTQDFYPEGDFVRSFAYLDNMGLVVGPPVTQQVVH